jgi:Type I restriction modification DNA specificity domain
MRPTPSCGCAASCSTWPCAASWCPSGIRIVRIQNLNKPDTPFNHCDPKFARENALIDNGSFLISWSGTPGTSFGAFIWDRGPAVLNQHIFRCDFKTNTFSPEYLRLAINGRLDEMIEKAHDGVGLQHITKGKPEAMLIGLPPFAQQHRIVAMLYVTGGLAYANFNRSVTLAWPAFGTETFEQDKTRWGWTFGFGTEWAVWDNWSSLDAEDGAAVLPIVAALNAADEPALASRARCCTPASRSTMIRSPAGACYPAVRLALPDPSSITTRCGSPASA